jgi:hypothetical protein
MLSSFLCEDFRTQVCHASLRLSSLHQVTCSFFEAVDLFCMFIGYLLTGLSKDKVIFE